jgi:hypothetical protein
MWMYSLSRVFGLVAVRMWSRWQKAMKQQLHLQ